MTDDNIKKMASMLRNGATMLDKYCPKCNSILFKIDNGKIYCPVCEMEVIIQKTDEMDVKKNRKHLINQNPTSKSIMEINNIFSEKLNLITEQIRSTEDLYQLEKMLEIAEKLLDILMKIREIQR